MDQRYFQFLLSIWKQSGFGVTNEKYAVCNKIVQLHIMLLKQCDHEWLASPDLSTGKKKAGNEKKVI